MQNLKSRKSPRLKEFDYSSAGLYFITFCTKNRAKILSNIVGGGAFDAPQIKLTRIGEIVKKYIISSEKIENVSIVDYVIMPDHVHLIIGITKMFDAFEKDDGTSRAPSPTNETIPHTISTLKRFINRDVGKDIFQRSYYDHIIRNSKDLEETLNYITANPFLWVEGKHDDSKFVKDYL